jgi:hypothetical protein
MVVDSPLLHMLKTGASFLLSANSAASFSSLINLLVCVCVLLLQDLLKSCSRGGRRRVEDMCYERRRAWACVDESAHHAVNAGERRRGSRRGVREGACIGGATMPQSWTLRLTRNAAALAAANPTLLFRPL